MITHTKNISQLVFHYTGRSLHKKILWELICVIGCVVVCLVSGPSRVSGLRAFLGCNLWLSCASPPLSWSLTVSAVVTSQWSWSASWFLALERSTGPGSPQHTDSKYTNKRPLQKRHPPKEGTKKRPQKRKGPKKKTPQNGKGPKKNTKRAKKKAQKKAPPQKKGSSKGLNNNKPPKKKGKDGKIGGHEKKGPKEGPPPPQTKKTQPPPSTHTHTHKKKRKEKTKNKKKRRKMGKSAPEKEAPPKKKDTLRGRKRSKTKKKRPQRAPDKAPKKAPKIFCFHKNIPCPITHNNFWIRGNYTRKLSGNYLLSGPITHIFV